MERLKQAYRHIGVEIPLFLYMVTAFIRNPVVHNLIYEKLCLEQYYNQTFCETVAEYHNDKEIHRSHSIFSAYSLYTLIFPSMVTTLLLGIVSDYYNIKIPFMVPYFGALAASVNLVVQSIYLYASPYYMLIGDLAFGLCGGYLAILSTTMSYGVKTTDRHHRSYRIASMETAIGFGGTIGYIFSGSLRAALGYTGCFILVVFLQSLAFFYILVFAKNPKIQNLSTNFTDSNNLLKKLKIVFKDFYGMLARNRPTRKHINLIFLGLAADLIIFAGLLDIQYSYLRFKLAWGDKEYGWFSGVSWGTAALTVMTLYPYFRYKGASDAQLATLGLVLKMIHLFLLAFVTSSTFAYIAVLFNIFSRFVNTGVRSLLSSLIETNEQGKMFSMVSLLEGVTSLLAALIYFQAYPWTLHFFPGFLFVFSSVLLIPTIIILWYCDRDLKKLQGRSNSTSSTSRH